MKKEEKKKIAMEFFKKDDLIYFFDIKELRIFIEKLEKKYDTRPIILNLSSPIKQTNFYLFDRLIKVGFNDNGELEFKIVEMFPLSYNHTVLGVLRKLKKLTSDKK